MSEQRVIEMSTDGPCTAESLAGDLIGLGFLRDATVLVHSSLSALGFVCGGPVAVVEALLTAVGPGGTLVMPAHSPQLSDPARWRAPPVPTHWWPVLRQHLPAFDPATTPTRGMGAIVKGLPRLPTRTAAPIRTCPSPREGLRARQICDGHTLSHRFGEHSPLARVYDADGLVLLLGVDHAVNTSLHLAEYRSHRAAHLHVHEPMPVTRAGGTTEWVRVDDIELDHGDFATLGQAFEAAHSEAKSTSERCRTSRGDARPHRPVGR